MNGWFSNHQAPDDGNPFLAWCDMDNAYYILRWNADYLEFVDDEHIIRRFTHCHPLPIAPSGDE